MTLLSCLTVSLLAQSNYLYTTNNVIDVWTAATGSIVRLPWTNILSTCTGPDLSGTNNPKFYPPNIKN